MSGSVINPPLPVTLPAEYSNGHPPKLPVAIDYPVALALCQMAHVQDELPKYLLVPESLHPRPAPQDAAGNALEYRSAD